MNAPSSPFLATAFLLVSLVALGGCASTIANTPPGPLPQAMPVDPPPGSAMLTANTFAGDALAAMLLKRVDASNGILVASFVEMENTEQSSPFGRTSMQQVSSRLGQHGFRVTEMRLGDGMRINPAQGEIMLTREASRLMAQEHNAHAVLLGMYSPTDANIFVSARVVRLSDSAVIAAYEYFIPYSEDAMVLLRQGNRQNNVAVWEHFASRGPAFGSRPALPANSTVRQPAASASAGRPVARSSGKKAAARRPAAKRTQPVAQATTHATAPAAVQAPAPAAVVDPCPEELRKAPSTAK
ncbi:FlgO family outer membrane protein [Desulfovibrio cuneatus]|uniref:FlgO family outer membrane protein n=1 Tax=Desulfovibrio cuneatus TaxID=159728 RepID=UPI0003F7F924|nr:FlgO family outer membrane protein [Desulfovibrio cuneatus]